MLLSELITDSYVDGGGGCGRYVDEAAQRNGGAVEQCREMRRCDETPVGFLHVSNPDAKGEMETEGVRGVERQYSGGTERELHSGRRTVHKSIVGISAEKESGA